MRFWVLVAVGFGLTSLAGYALLEARSSSRTSRNAHCIGRILADWSGC
jgi:hypothetical protein